LDCLNVMRFITVRFNLESPTLDLPTASYEPQTWLFKARKGLKVRPLVEDIWFRYSTEQYRESIRSETFTGGRSANKFWKYQIRIFAENLLELRTFCKCGTLQICDLRTQPFLRCADLQLVDLRFAGLGFFCGHTTLVSPQIRTFTNIEFM
jgi:hypothetical protein